MNIRKIEVVLLSVVTLVIVVCVVVVYISHFLLESEYEDCRYYAKGVVTGVSFGSEQLNVIDAIALGAQSDVISLKQLHEKSVLDRRAASDSYAATNGIYKAAYDNCVSNR